MQTLIVAALVAVSVVYASWTLMPSALRKALARGLLKLDLWPSGARAWLERRATASAGCGCDGCDAGAPPKSGAAGSSPSQHPIHFHPRARR